MNRIKELRRARGITQDELGVMLGVQKAAVCKYETERVALPNHVLVRLVDIFGVSADYILGRADEIPADRAADAYIGEHWKKYLLLSDAGREMVDVMLDAVYERERDASNPR